MSSLAVQPTLCFPAAFPAPPGVRAPVMARLRLARHLRRGLLWLVIVALCVYASSGAVLRMLGPTHWHAPSAHPAAAAPAPAMGDLLGPSLRRAGAWLDGLQALADQAHAQAHALGMAPAHHRHSAVLRHWHGADDDSVRRVADQAADPELADLKAAAAIGGATQLLAFGPACTWQAPRQAGGAWPQECAPPWRSIDTAPPLEPPIA